MISALVLAAGQSKRMGSPKMTLPWGNTTIIGQVVRILHQACISDIVVVTGGAHQEVEAALRGSPARLVFNPRFAEEDMGHSLQVGLASLGEEVEAALLALGDQPQMELAVVEAIITAYLETGAPLVIPSYQMRRGHPWILSRSLWPEVMALPSGGTVRDIVHAHAALIHYVLVESASILHDVDTPQDYQRSRPAD